MKKVLSAPWRLFVWLYETHPMQTIAAMLLVVALSAAASGYANVALGQSNAKNAVTSCENANESRTASRVLWNFVLDLTSTNAGADANKVAYLGQVRDWVNKIYEPHDCDDLSRKYELPPPPKIPSAA